LVLALSGGAVHGAIHIGVLQALDEAGIKPDGIAGTSIGALIGGLYAAGMSPGEIASRLEAIDLSGVIIDKPERPTLMLARKEEHSRHLLTVRLDPSLTPVVPGAITPGQKLYRMLLELTLDAPYSPCGNWDNFPTPLRILATDMVTGKPVVFDSGDLAFGIRGSLSLPLLFDPLARDTLQLIDGGISANIPVEQARTMGGDVVVAVDATTGLSPLAEHYEPWQIVDLVTTILEEGKNGESLAAADLVIAPQTDTITFGAPTTIGSLIQAGRTAMKAKLPELTRLLEPVAQPDDSVRLNIKTVKVDANADANADADADRLSTGQLTSASASFLQDTTQTTTIGAVRGSLRRLFGDGTVQNAVALYDSASAVLTIKITRNPLLRGVAFRGDLILPDIVLRAPFDQLIGERLDYNAIHKGQGSLLRRFRTAGFSVAQFSVMMFDTSTGILNLTIDAGRLDQINFVGLNRVPAPLMDREIPLRRGSLITRAGLLKGMSNLYATGHFRAVFPVLRRSEPPGAGWTIEIHVSEQPGLPLRLGLAYQAEQRTRGFAELVYPAPFYYAMRMVLFTSVGERDREHSLSLHTDRGIGLLPMTYQVSGYFNRRERTRFNPQHKRVLEYTQERSGSFLELGGPALSWGLLAVTARYEQHRNHYGAQAQVYHLGAIGARLALDTQDRNPFPRNGIKANGYFETAGNYLGTETRFTKLWGGWEGYLTPVRRFTFGFRLCGRASDRTTPTDEQFRLGGIDSFPGLHLDEAVGGIQFTSGIETRYDLISRVLADTYIGWRYDLAGSWENPETRISRRDWMSSFAAYIALDTFLGPLKLQWGYLFGSGAASSQGLVMLQAGNQF
jgi:NTE family protein